MPHHLRVAARRDGEQIAVEDRDALIGERGAQRDSGQPEIAGGVAKIVVARADPHQTRAERVQGIRQTDKVSPRSRQPRDPDFRIVQEPPRRDHTDALECRLRLRQGMPSRAWYLRGDRNRAATQIQEIPGRGHSLVFDSGWQDVAEAALTFIKSTR